MPDISLCVWTVEKCCLAPKCYRATAEPDDTRQSYFAPDAPGEGCKYYIEAEEKYDERHGH